MIKRTKFANGNTVLVATRLGWEARLMPRGFVPVAEEPSQEQSRADGRSVSKLSEIIELMNEIKQAWDILPSEQIVNTLNQVCLGSGTVMKANLSAQSELWLLQALAIEKSLTADVTDLEACYSKCRGGVFQMVLVLNNCGVIQANYQKCGEALELFKEAMICAHRMNKLSKAPFYNFALVLAHLYQQRFIFHADYQPLLEDVIETLPFLRDLKRARPEASDSSAKAALDEAQIRSIYTGVAKFAHGISDSIDDKFYSTKLSYLVPKLDLLGSFGDTLDKYDRETAVSVFSKGKELAGEKKYAESISAFEISGRLAPDYSKGAEEEIAKVSDTWRRDANVTIFKLLEEKNFDRAIETLRYPPDQRLARQNDQGLIESIERRKQISLLHEADVLAAQGNVEGAKLKYKLLLREDLSDYLRKHASIKLAQLLKSDEQPVSEDKQG